MWGIKTLRGMQPGTTYTFAVKARNGDGVETAFSPGASLTTLSPASTGDMNCDGAVNFRDINPFILALTSPDTYAQSFTGSDYLNADINGDGAANFKDINPFVALLTTGGTGGT